MIQLQFLNRLLSSKDASLITINNLTDEYFSDYKDEFNYIKNHLKKYGNIPDKVTFVNVFPDFDITEVTESDNYLLDALYEDRNKRVLAETFNAVRDALVKGDTEKALRLYNSSSETLAKAKHVDSVDLYEDTARYDEYVDKSLNPVNYFVKTGYPELDEIIGGWDRKGDYVTIIARPGQSKTFNLLKTAVAAAEQGLKVGIYSGEMSVAKIGYRVDTLMSHISNYKMMHGSADIQVDYKKFLDGVKGRLKGSIRVLTPDMVGGSVGVGVLRAFIEKDHLDMLCVDQHSLLEDDRGAKNPVERAANISKDIKNLETMAKIPIITVSQQNRESTEETGVSVRNVSQSDRIGQDSHIVIALEKKENVLTLHIIKARDGGDGKTLKYYIDLDKGIFQFIPNEDDATGGKRCEELKNEYEGEDDEYEDDAAF